MIVRKALLKDLQGQVKALEKDLREQVSDAGEVYARLRPEYDRAFKLGRTAATWPVWRDERVTQAAVAWVLGTVFVRFCEDNGLLGSSAYLAGPSAERMALAEESQEEYFRTYPANTDRDWILASFGEIASSQAGKLLFDPKHNAAYQIPVSHDAAKSLIAFWRRRNEYGYLRHSFENPEWDTRFLGDLYQDLSESARRTYALLQTPDFVEQFILDLTLKPFLDRLEHDVVKIIDPTCGSGHFVLSAFQRLLGAWSKNAPGREAHERVKLALDAVHGVDINPFAVAVARFRLLITALRECGFETLDDIKEYDFPLHLAIGDSLIKHRQLSLFDDVDELAEFKYATEDLDEHPGILDENQYHVVVGNPPYITVKDHKLNALYRETYSACSGKYALSVPFAQRFFELALKPDTFGHGAGHVGQITANSFMKREFGKKLIEQFFAREANLTHIIDTSGAYIPAHGTPTVILVGQPPSSRRNTTVRIVMGIRGEPEEPEKPSKGHVWQAIVDQVSRPGSESQWVSVSEINKDQTIKHPWSLSGGGANNLTRAIETNSDTVRGHSRRVGVLGMTNADEAMLAPKSSWVRRNGEVALNRRMVVGDQLRDWVCADGDWAFFPYTAEYSLKVLSTTDPAFQWLWPCRTVLGHRATFSKESYFTEGRPWYEWHQITRDPGTHPWTICFGEVATHNHFVLDRGGTAFKQTAPLIKLSDDATEDDHLRLLGVLNSSTACFWLKQSCFPKGGSGMGRGIQPEDWMERFAFNASNVERLPLPTAYPLELSREIERLAQRLDKVNAAAVTSEATPTRECLEQAKAEWHSARGRMVALQEELDWQVYSLYGLLDEELTAPAESVPELKLGERAFEIVLARKMARGEAETQWFARHGSTPVTELPGHWAAEYRAVVEKRIEVIESNRNIALIERPECKRRWATEGWDAMQAKALRDWLLDRCETRDLWYHHVDGVEQPRPMSTAQLADELRRDPNVLAVADLYAPGKDLAKVIADLVADEHVPYLATMRYKNSGLAKRADWEHVWDLQRQEDAAPDEPAKKKIRDTIPVPPKYTSADFAKTSYWSNRGKLDVPKERFISYPHAGRDGDPSLLIGWAGWDHREQAQALAILIVDREQTDGWGADRLTPLLAGLREVLPWVRQWHGEFDPTIGDSPAAIYDAFLADTTNRLHLTDNDLTGWQPPKATRGLRKA